MKNLMYGIVLSAGLIPSILWAQTDLKPVIHTFTFEDGASISGMSDNGLWATAKGKNAENETLDAYPYLLNIKDGTRRFLLTDAEAKIPCGAYDVSNDGTVVGGYNGYPATYKESEGWKRLQGTVTGEAEYITGDGKYIIGIHRNGLTEYPLLWENGVLQTLEGLPTIDAGGYRAEQNRFTGISADGNLLLGCLSYSHPGWGCCYYVYNRTTKKYKMLGWEEVASPGHVDQAMLSLDGKWVTGTVHTAFPIEGSQFYEESDVTFRYDVEKDEFILNNNGSEDLDVGGFAINNNGTVFGASPFSNPARTLQYKIGKYWYSLELVLKERYGIDYMTTTGYDYSGTPIAISQDGKTMAAVAMSNTFNYVIVMPETFEEAASTVNLLANPVVYPGNGYIFSKLKIVNVTFDKEAQVKENAKAYLYEGENQVASSMSIRQTTTSDKSFAITFRTTRLEDGKRYTVKIPAGTFYLPETEIENEEINITYTGREEKPVQATRISPADGNSVSEISYNSPINFTFDVPLSLVEGSVGKLYQEGNEEPLCDLVLATASNMMAAYPALIRYLYKDLNYKVVIPANCVTDIMGDCPNEEITLHYTGIYERPLQEVANDIFSDDFSDPSSSYTRFLLWDGDKNTPNAAMQQMKFDSENTPWNFTIAETETSSDYCAGSTSMYTPAGQSNDWMSTIQLYLPNKDYYLYFNSQSYKKNKEDRLKVFVWTNDAVMSYLNDELIAQFEAEGDCIYNEIESPGADEEKLAGEWKHNKLSLAEYAGKNIYIAFVNQNRDQSMIMLDSIHVTYEGPFALGSNTETAVVREEEIEVSGYIKITDDGIYNTLRAYYKDESGTQQESKTFTDLELTNGDIYKFTFDKKLPLEIGKITNFSIGVEINGGIQEISLSVKNLAFAPTKRVVVEEGTGTWCGNCPLGILALEHLEKQFADKVIPVGIHYNDIYEYLPYIAALDFQGYPTGMINRVDSLYSPMHTEKNAAGDTDAVEFVSPEGNKTFTDIVIREFQTQAEADIALDNVVYDETTGYLSVTTNVTYAVDMKAANYNVFYVIMEDGLVGNQVNYFYNISHPNLGEWGKGGIYGISSTPFTYNDVARAIIGTSFNGISGYIPNNITANEPITFEILTNIPAEVSDMKNASVVCMLISGNTRKVVNAAKAYFTKGSVDGSSIDTNTVENQNAIIRTDGQDVNIQFNKEGNALVTLYDINGRLINQAQAKVSDGEHLKVSTNGNTGIIIAKVISNNQVTVQKLVIR